MYQIVSSVKYCHSKGVIHKDIKPSNIFVDKDRLYILNDYGVS